MRHARDAGAKEITFSRPEIKRLERIEPEVTPPPKRVAPIQVEMPEIRRVTTDEEVTHEVEARLRGRVTL